MQTKLFTPVDYKIQCYEANSQSTQSLDMEFTEVETSDVDVDFDVNVNVDLAVEEAQQRCILSLCRRASPRFDRLLSRVILPNCRDYLW